MLHPHNALLGCLFFICLNFGVLGFEPRLNPPKGLVLAVTLYPVYCGIFGAQKLFTINPYYNKIYLFGQFLDLRCFKIVLTFKNLGKML